jgi:hypothetical protein
MFGLYGTLFALFAVGLTAVSLCWKQRWSVYVFGAGVVLAGVLVATIYLNYIAIYVATGISIYAVIILAAILLFAGGFGLGVQCIRWLDTAFARRPRVS